MPGICFLRLITSDLTPTVVALSFHPRLVGSVRKFTYVLSSHEVYTVRI